MLLNISFLILTITGILLLVYGLQKTSTISTFLSIIFILIPTIYYTLGLYFLPLAPALTLIIIYISIFQKHKNTF